MGLAASQARLLLLTARKNDLEYRAQQITNSQMTLAMQTEQVAREYSIKISNQALFFIDSTDANQPSKCLTADDINDLLKGGVYHLEERDANGGWQLWDETNSSNIMPLELLEAINNGTYRTDKSQI